MKKAMAVLCLGIIFIASLISNGIVFKNYLMEKIYMAGASKGQAQLIDAIASKVRTGESVVITNSIGEKVVVGEIKETKK